MPDKLPPNASLRQVVQTLPEARRYLANVRLAMKKDPFNPDNMFVRIGVLGEGISPNFRVESANGNYKLAYNGRTFELFGEQNTRDLNWSSHASTYAEVEELLNEQREIEKKKPR